MPRRSKQQIEDRLTTDIDSYVGLRIRKRRAVLGIGQKALGTMLGVSFQQVQKYENGKNRVSASTLYLLAQALQVPITWFFEGIEAGRSSVSSTPSNLADPEVLRFVRAYYRIEDVGVRNRLRSMISSLGDEKPLTERDAVIGAAKPSEPER